MAKKDKFERLLDLIQNGRTSAIRKAAATQIGFLQKEFSYDLSTILHKLYPLLLYHDFECRRAAAMALENLIKNCRPAHSKWKTDRPLMKLYQFDLSKVISSAKRLLTHNLTDHNISDKDYKDQVFSTSTDPSNDVAELCEISEQMIMKLLSPNWHYRHGAVVCLLSTIEPNVPKDYREDLAVRLLTLVALDRFKDFSTDAVKVPVVDPACHLLARCLMLNVNQALPILEQFHSYRIDADDDDQNSDDGWSLRFAFWVIIQHMLLIDKNCIDPALIQKYFLETVRDDKDEQQEEVVTAALEAILMIIPNIPDKAKVASTTYFDIFESAEDLSSSNTACTKVLESFINDCDITDFVDEETFDLLIKHCRFPQSSTREATYSLIMTLLKRRGLDIYNGFDFIEFMKKIVQILLLEEVQDLFRKGIKMIPTLNDLMKVKRILFDEDVAAKVMDSMHKDFAKMARIIPIIMEIGTICDIDELQPKFTHIETAWGVAYCIVLCLNKNTGQPVFNINNTNIFTKDPINFLYSLFTLKSEKVLGYIPRIEGLHPSLALFACKYIGRFLHDEQDDEIINQLIQMNVDFEEGLLKKFFVIDKEDPEKDHRFYSSIITEPSNQRPHNVRYAQTIAVNAVYKIPYQLDSIFDLLQLLYCIQAKMTLPVDTVRMMIRSMMKGKEYLPSMLAYNANLFAKMHPDLFLTSFVKMIDEKPDLTSGPIEFIDLFVTDFDTKKLDLLSWASFFVKPALRNFANQDEVLRRMAAHSLSQIIRLLSLDDGNCSTLPEELHELKRNSMQYLAPLYDVTKATEWKLDPPPDFSFMNGEGKIRFYQRDGINWLGFLYNYGLNGILADDMGLGKTFQCLCAISNAHTDEYSHRIPLDYSQSNVNNAPFSLVVCPPSVIDHWVRETRNFFPKMPVNAFFTKNEVSQEMFNRFEGILVTSYGVVRGALNVLTSRVFTYCVLDEGHVIKNKNAKVAQAVTKLRARHRLILSGTPIQNNVEELYSLMDFLMPGYLGTQQSFKKKFENLIGRMFNQDATEKDTERGQEALQLLHCQVLPFIMRRLRNQVLEELPPRVTYDEVFQMTDEQRVLFDRLRKTSEALPTFDGNNNDNDKSVIEIDEHVFTKMRKERDLCIHPCLVDPTIERTIEKSGKMKELKKILLTQLGLGGGNDQMRNRALLFAQSSKTLDIVKEIVIDNLEGVTCDFFDGRVNERDRQRVLDRFNRDDGPDLLLLTTAIGGLGLNLQVANNVIFLENSWNFTDDEQAMARAHRMGQKRTVTVFNLITYGTIEQRILEVQRKKRNMVNTIINEDNIQSNADISIMQDQIYRDDNQSVDTNKKATQSEILKESEKLVTNQEQYERDYRNDDKWIEGF